MRWKLPQQYEHIGRPSLSRRRRTRLSHRGHRKKLQEPPFGKRRCSSSIAPKPIQTLVISAVIAPSARSRETLGETGRLFSNNLCVAIRHHITPLKKIGQLTRLMPRRAPCLYTRRPPAAVRDPKACCCHTLLFRNSPEALGDDDLYRSARARDSLSRKKRWLNRVREPRDLRDCSAFRKLHMYRPSVRLETFAHSPVNSVRMQGPQSRRSHPKELGAFYTPTTIAERLADWVVRSGAERLLEPSVGAGALVKAATDRAVARGMDALPRLLVCDIDLAAIEVISLKLPVGSEARAIDFLQLEPTSTGLFDGVIANPPFTRNHAMSIRRRTLLRKRFSTTGSPGLWVHFLVHSLDFLVKGGRLAAIVPASALFANYGRAALERLAAKFQSVELYRIVDKPLWVNCTDERGAIILANGYGLGPPSCQVRYHGPQQGSSSRARVRTLRLRLTGFRRQPCP